MFYTENKISMYPNRRIAEDMMRRDGSANLGYTFSPYNGVKSRVAAKLVNTFDVAFDPVVILNKFKTDADFSPKLARANNDSAKRDYSASEVDDYYENLEDISEDYVVQYIDSVLYNFRNKQGLGNLRYEMRSYNYFVDEEDGSLVNPTDLKELDKSYSVDEINTAKEKLPYLLKQIHYGSKKRGVSLLSFIIVRQRFIRDGRQTFYWHDYIDAGVYYMSATGIIGARIPREAQKNTAWSNALLDWINGAYPDDMYYRAYIELLRVMEVLNLDITGEDPGDFDERYLSKVLCTYIPSNKEYLETYCAEDAEILMHLSPEGLNEMIKHISSESQVENSTHIKSRISDIASNLNLGLRTDDVWRPQIPKVRRLIKMLAHNDVERDCWLHSFCVVDGVITNSGGAYFVWHCPVDGKNYALTASGNFVGTTIYAKGLRRRCVDYLMANDVIGYIENGTKFNVYEQDF